MQAFIRAAQIRLACPDLGASLRFYTEKLGFRVELVMPADAPSLAVVSGHGLSLRLESAAPARPRGCESARQRSDRRGARE